MAKARKGKGGKKGGKKGGQKPAGAQGGETPPGGGPEGVEGRSDGGQEKVIKLESLTIRVDHLVTLKRKVEDATVEFSDAIKKVAEDAGLEAKVVRAFIAARAGERFQERKRDANQLSLCFNEVGE